MWRKTKSIGTFLIGWPLSLIALFFIFRLISPHFSDLSSHIASINYWMVGIGALCFVVYYFLRSYIYQLILKYLGYTLSLQESAFYWAQSEIHRYIPGNIWSFLGRSVLFSRKNVDKKDIATSLIVENQLVILGTLTLSLLAASFIIRLLLPNLVLQNYLPILAILGTSCLLLIYLYSQTVIKFIKSTLVKKIFFTPFTPYRNTVLIFTSCVSYLFFGLGYYFVTASFVPINPQQVWVFVGFFVFALLVGFVSFITPTGLGVREGLIILGLKNIAETGIVGFVAIFTRIILVLSELLYLLISYIWQRLHQRVSHIEPFIADHKHELLLSLAILTYTSYFSLTSFLRYDHFYTGRFDLGNMAQTVWNTYHGNFFRLTNPNGIEEVSRLAFHADFILILLSPFYFLWENPKMLLLLQSVVTGFGAFFVYLIAQRVLKGKTLPLVLSFIFLLNPSVQRANIYDFHAVVLATTFLLGAFYFLMNKRYVWFGVFLLLACLTKEQVWLIAAFFGLYISIFMRKLYLGLSIFLIGVGMFVFLIFQAIPAAAGSGHFALEYYEDFGENPGDIVKNIVFSPHKTIPLLFEKDRIYFYEQQLVPVGYVALLSPFYFLFAAGDLGIDLLSSNPQLRQIYYQYTATITPFVFLAAIYGIKRFERIFPGVPRMAMVIYIGLMGIYGAYLYGPLPGAKGNNLAMYTNQRPNASEIDSFLTSLPLEYTVMATNNAASHLSHRRNIYVFPRGLEQADVVVLLSDRYGESLSEREQELATSLKHNANYLMFKDEKGFIVFKKIQQF